MENSSLPLPPGIEIEKLVQRLYTPGLGNALEIKQIEAHLRELQRSPQGWEMADFLLGCENTHVRFFGALTFQVKLNTGSSGLDDVALQGVGQRLIYWFITSIQRGDSSVILRKLCAALALYYHLDRDVESDTCVRHVILSIAHNEPVNFGSSALPDPGATLETLDHSRIAALLWFLISLTEDATKQVIEQDSRIAAAASSKLEANLDDASAVIRHCFSTSRIYEGGQNNHKLQIDGLTSLATLAFFAQKSWITKEENLRPIRSLLDVALDWFQMAGTDEGADVIADLLSNFGTLFTPQHLQSLCALLLGPWGEEHIQGVLVEATDELPPFVRLLIAFGDLSLQQLATHPGELTSQQIMDAMHKLLQSPGFAAVEDIIAVEALEFWLSFVEFVIDSEFEEPDEARPWLESANGHIMQTFHELWRKIKLPTSEQFKHLDADRQKEFRQFRSDVKELLVSSYPVLRSTLTQAIAQLCLESFTRHDWLEVEASLFCLNAISIAEQEKEDHILAQLFGSSLYVQLKEADASIPARTRGTAVDLLGQYAEFFERHTEYLPSALDFLFASLRSPNLALKSAKSIGSLSSSCRTSLAPQLPNFVQAYEHFLAWPTAEYATKEKVIGGIAAIVQALPSLEDQVVWLKTLLAFVQQDVLRAADHFSISSSSEEGQVAALNALKCLASIGKASQAQQDEVVDDDFGTVARVFWSQGAGASIQVQIFDIIRKVLGMLNQSPHPLELHGEIFEAVCQAFKAGFTETKPGPFVFSAGVFVDFFGTVGLSTPRLELVLSTACSFLRSHSHATSPDVMHDATRLLHEVIRIISEIQNLREEDNTMGLIEVMERFMPRYTSIFFTLQQQDLETLFSFPLHCLSLPEPLPKRAAAGFWAAFFQLTPGRSKVSQEHLDDVINHFGPRLATELVQNIAGGATRTDLEWFAEPLKKFSGRTVHTKKFLESALMGTDAGPSVGPDVKARFLKQLTVSNTIGTTKKVMTAFWSQCKGMGNYAP